MTLLVKFHYYNLANMSQIIPINIPTYISDQNYNPSRVLPRLFYYNGLVDCETYYIESGSLTQSGVTYAQTSFPYFDNYNVVTGSFPTAGSKSLLFNNEAVAYGALPSSSLFLEYWDSYVSLLYNPKTRLINCSAIIPLADYFKMELNDIVEWRGNYYHLRAINNYNLSNGECQLQLLGPILGDIMGGILPKDCGFNFVVEDATEYLITYYIFAGGGGGGRASTPAGYAGGGGGGGVISGSMFIPTGSAFPIVVGSGGTGFIAGAGPGGSGSVSSGFGYTALGGGGGGGGATPNGGDGGCGGGGAYNGQGGTGSMGYNGAAGEANRGGGGGGGTANAGTLPIAIGGGNYRGGTGGDGIKFGIPAYQITSSFYWGAGGGGGGAQAVASSCGLGGSPTFAGYMGGKGGGNTNCNLGGTTAMSATTGQGFAGGGGGGGAGTFSAGRGGNGDQGSVWISYSGNVQRGTGGTVYISGSLVFHQFMSSGNYNS